MVAGAAAVVAVVVAGCASAWSLSQRVDRRATARAFAAVAPGEAVAFERSALFDETAEGDQVYVYWWRVVDAEAAVPGVDDPAVGDWFVSPALADRIAGDPVLADRYPGARRIGPEGIAHPRELLAYRFVGPDVPLSERLADRPGRDWIGDGGEAVDAYPIAVAAVALVGVPGLGLLVAAMAPSAGALARRLRLLTALGASPSTRRRLVVTHAALCAGPGALGGAVAWYVVAPELTTVPLVGRAVFAADLRLPAATVVAVACGVTALVAAVAAIRPRRLAGNRPGDELPGRPSAARALPLVASLVVMLAGVVVPGRPGAKLFLAGVVASAVGAVIALPYLLFHAGERLAAGAGVLRLLVGRRLQWNAVASARSLLTIGGLAVLVPLTAAWVAVARDVDPPPATSEYAVEVRGGLAPGERAALVERTGAVPVDVVTRAGQDGTEEAFLVGDCGALADHVELNRCGPGGFDVAPGAGASLGGYTTLPGTPTPPSGTELRATLFVSDEPAAVERALRSLVVNGSDPGRQVAVPGRQVFHESPLVSWILGAGRLAAIVGGLALVLHLAGHAARLARSRSRLLALGADQPVVRRLAGAEAAIPVAITGVGGVLVGLVASWLFVQMNGAADIPYVAIALVVAATAAVAAAAGVVGALAVAHPPPTTDDRSA